MSLLVIAFRIIISYYLYYPNSLLMKHILLFSLLLLAKLTEGQITNPAPYCPHEYDGGASAKVHYISSFTLGTFSHITGSVQWPYPHYVYYNNLNPGNLIFGQAYNYTIGIDTMGNTKFVQLWTDWNKNGIFETTEVYFHSVQAGVSTVNGTISIPVVAGSGITRFRIAVTEDTSLTFDPPCSTTADWGETEDYDFDIGFTTGVNNPESNNIISVYPVPGKNNITVYAPGKTIDEIRIYDLTSRLIYSNNSNPKEKVELQLDYVPSGSYMLITKVNGELLRKNLVIE
jgi:GEVED domain/Secretion system C-terminal sorting domain